MENTFSQSNLVFFDIDGTLWDYKGNIPESTVWAVRELRRKGNFAFLCSGRSRIAIQAQELLEIGFDGIVAGCGTYVEYMGDVIFEHIIPWPMLSEIKNIFQECHLSAMYEGSKKIYADIDGFRGDAYVEDFQKALGEDFQGLDALTEESIVNKLCVDYRRGSREEMAERLGRDYEMIWHDFGPVAELIPKSHSKATGIRRVCEYLGVDRERTFAFGDSANDIDMLRYAQYGIAMGNASEPAKQAADYVTASMYEEGIKKGLEHFGLIG